MSEPLDINPQMGSVAASLYWAIKRSQLAQQNLPGPSPAITSTLDPGPEPGAAQVPGGLLSSSDDPGAPPGAPVEPVAPQAPPAHQTVCELVLPNPPKLVGRDKAGRRVWSDNRRFDRTQPRKHAPSNSTPGLAKAKLAGLAKQNGLATLPGDGNLSLATRHLKGGRPTVIQYIRLAAADQDPHATTWLHLWDSLKPWEQAQVTLDDVCAASGISPVKLLKIIVGCAYEAGCDVANLVAAQAHPKVVEAATVFAQYKDGIEDRKLLFQHHGFTPTPKGTTINVVANASAQANAVSQSDGSLPSFLEDVEALHAPVQSVQKQLAAPSDPIEADWLEVKDACTVSK